MKWEKVLIIFSKELRESFRDKMVILTNFVFPFAYTAIWFALTSGLVIYGSGKIQKYNYVFSSTPLPELEYVTKALGKEEKITWDQTKFSSQFKTELRDLQKLLDKFEEQQRKIEKTDKTPNREEDKASLLGEKRKIEETKNIIVDEMSKRKIDLFLLASKNGQDSLKIYQIFDYSNQKSLVASKVVSSLVEKESQKEIEKRLKNFGKKTTFINPYELRSIPMTLKSQISAAGVFGVYYIGSFIAMLLLLAMYYPTINATIGEKTKFTLRPLLLNPVSSLEILLGKYLNITIQGLLGTLPWVIITLIFVFFASKIEHDSFFGTMKFATLPLFLANVVALALLVSSLCFFLAVLARTMTQAQTLLSVAMFLTFIPATVVAVAEIKLDLFTSCLPLVNFIAFVKDYFIASCSWQWGIMTALFNIAYSLFILGLVVQVFNYQMVWSTGQFTISDLISFKRLKLEKPNASISFLLAIMIFMGIFLLGSTTGEKGLFWQLLINPFVFCLGFSWFLLRYYRLDFKTTINLKKVNAIQVCSAFAIGIVLVLFMLPVAQYFSPPKIIEDLLPKFNFSLPFKLVTIALGAGICEEIAFRGVILRGLRASFPTFFSVFISAMMFAAIHLDVIKFFPITLVGIILAMVSLRNGIIPCMIIHICYNGLFVLIDHYKIPVSLLISPGPWYYNVLYYLSLGLVMGISLRQFKIFQKNENSQQSRLQAA
jgi:sodium transport system permease protein